MVKRKIVFIVFTLLFAIPARSQIINGSFENDSGAFSLEGWRNYISAPSSDTPPGGGNWSVEIGGGDVVGSCVQTIADIQYGGIYELKCWAKLLAGWGRIGWYIDRNPKRAVFVTDTMWTQISVVDTFFIGSSDSVQVALESAGGLYYSGATLFDLVQVQKTGTVIWIGVKPSVPLPEVYCLRQNYPNPFNPETIINYEIPVLSYTALAVYDLFGRQVAAFVYGIKEAGSYSVIFDGTKLAGGVYFVRMSAQPSNGSNRPGGIFVQVRKMVLIK
jgi:hypothetical protein